MKRRASAAITYILMFAIALISVLIVFTHYKDTPKIAAEQIDSATSVYSKTLSSEITTP